MDVEAIVIGAGVVGLAVARRLAQSGVDVLVLEAEDKVGSQTSARNSEVIHAGLYYPQGSLKARTCVEGREMLYAYCRDRNIPARKIGKLVVATDDAQLPRLEEIFRQGESNGVEDLVWLDAEGIRRIEPEVRCRAGFFSPSTGIVDSFALMLALQADAENSGAQFALRTRATGASLKNSGFSVDVGDDALACNLLINCAGHGAHAIALAMPDYPRNLVPPRTLAKGNYCSVAGRAPFSHLVYPLPEPGGVGVHVTLDLAGNMRLGPDVQWIEDIDLQPTPGIEPAFRASVAKFWPGIEAREIAASTCGIRPKISGPGEANADFRIDGPEAHGVPGLVHCFGIESPGLTASLALAELIAAKLEPGL
jgi:L-2-hydroxyglutarate oxidase LhgO